MIEKLWVSLAIRDSSRFVRISLLAFLAVGIYFAATIQLYQYGDRLNPLSIFSFLPNNILFNRALFDSLRITFIISASLWALHLLTPLSSWLAVLSYTLFASQTAESSLYTGHQYNLLNLLLVVYAFWYQVEGKGIKPIRSLGCFFGKLSSPRWVYFLSLFLVCSLYSLSGLTKIAHCGLDWANGVSLQLWIHRFADHNNFLAALTIAYWPLAVTAQALVLFAEAAAALALLWKPFRPVIGVLLLGFHLSNEWLFGFGFYANGLAILLILVLSPLWPPIGREV